RCPSCAPGHARICGWPGSRLYRGLADHGDVKGVIFARCLARVVRNDLDVIRVVTDCADASFDRASTGAGTDSVPKLGVASAGRGSNDQLSGNRATEVEDVLTRARLC